MSERCHFLMFHPEAEEPWPCQRRAVGYRIFGDVPYPVCEQHLPTSAEARLREVSGDADV